ncbi:MAG: Na/Pi cotransporter family protein [Planctomycetota bacterium]|nr:Na/Pi cotransporter family protein [Planctomycetota bacterium]
MNCASIEFGTMAMGLFGGLAVFLFGMELMTDALKTVAGDGMRKLLARLTTNRFKAVLAGGFTTAVIQSSSVTTVLTVGFVSAGLISLQQSVGIIMGAEIGTTITAQIIAFKVTKYALAIVAVGFILKFFFKSEKVRQYGVMILGFGLVFFGMTLMKKAMGPLKEYDPFLNLMQGMDNPLFGILTGALFTGLVQSSSATTGVVIALGASGLVSLEGAIALVFGANIGTCVTALLASIGKQREAVQTALVHVTFNSLGVILWFAFIPMLADAVRDISSDPARQIANAHTAFNVANTCLFIGFTGVFARFVTWVLPIKPEVVPGRLRPKFLDENLLETPALALDRVEMELGRLGKRVRNLVRRAPSAIMTGTEEEIRAVERMDDDVDVLHKAIVDHLSRLSAGTLDEKHRNRLHGSLTVANYLENMADVVETNLVSAGLRRTRHDVQISEGTQEFLDALTDRVVWAVRRSVRSVRRNEPSAAQEVIAAKGEIMKLADDANDRLMERLGAPEAHRMDAFRVESELVEALKRIYYLARRIAEMVAEGDWSLELHLHKKKKKKKKKKKAKPVEIGDEDT